MAERNEPFIRERDGVEYVHVHVGYLPEKVYMYKMSDLLAVGDIDTFSMCHEFATKTRYLRQGSEKK